MCLIFLSNKINSLQKFIEMKELVPNIDSKEFKSQFKTRPYIHFIAIAFNWLLILFVISLYQHFSIIWIYPLIVIIIGARMHALTVLMHDATHYRFLKNRKWNDWISNFAIMFPLFTSIEKYRYNHIRHHQHLNSMKDPDWVAKLTKREFQFPKKKSEFLLTLSSYLLFYQGILDALWFLKRYKNPEKSSVKEKTETQFFKYSFYLILFSILMVFGLMQSYLLFWIVPYLTSFFMFQYIRSVAEHFGELTYEDSLSSTRTVVPTKFERFLIAPHNVSFHIEHHLFPGVPFYNLPNVHKILMKEEEYQANAHITKGYFLGLLQELGKA